jgi:hypothetical protein
VDPCTDGEAIGAVGHRWVEVGDDHRRFEPTLLRLLVGTPEIPARTEHLRCTPSPELVSRGSKAATGSPGTRCYPSEPTDS